MVILMIMSILAAFSEVAAQRPQQLQPLEKRIAGLQRQDQPHTTQHTGTLSQADRAFATKAAQDGMAEVAMGELAAKQASNDAVKQFGQRMVDDHTKANNELKKLAAKEGIALPSEMSAKQKASQDRLAKLSGADFDREYMRAMVKDHDSAVAMFEKQSRSGSDPELKAWAAKTIPVLREHQKQAHDLSAKVGAKTGD
jgi:putative membrane protein